MTHEPSRDPSVFRVIIAAILLAITAAFLYYDAKTHEQQTVAVEGD